MAASVLGEEVERSALAAVSELDTELGDALGELVSAGLLTEASGQGELSYRFRHALIREATYNGLLRPQRRQLHARAAWSLETSAEDRLEDVAAVLGRHFAAAGEGERAVHYLEMAGDHARRLYANEEAIAAYRDALAVIDATLSPTVVRDGAFTAERSAIAAVLCGKLGMVFRLIDRFGEARAAVLDGLARAPDEDRLLVARLQGSLSNIEMQDRRYDAALAAADAAEESLGRARSRTRSGPKPGPSSSFVAGHRCTSFSSSSGRRHRRSSVRVRSSRREAASSCGRTCSWRRGGCTWASGGSGSTRRSSTSGGASPTPPAGQPPPQTGRGC